MPSSGCEWVDSLNPPEAAIDALQGAQNRQVDDFARRIFSHDEKFDRFCPDSATHD